MKRLVVSMLVLLPSILFAAAPDWDSAAKNLLSREDVSSALSGKRIAIVCEDTPIHRAVIRSIQAEALKIATVVLTDDKIIKKEVDRQLSGLVDDEYMEGIGHQYGAQIVLEVSVLRVPKDPTKLKISMMAVSVRTNALEASGVFVLNVPRGFDISDIEVPLKSPLDEIKEITNDLIAGKDRGVRLYPEEAVKAAREPVIGPFFKNLLDNMSRDVFIGGRAAASLTLPEIGFGAEVGYKFIYGFVDLGSIMAYEETNKQTGNNFYFAGGVGFTTSYWDFWEFGNLDIELRWYKINSDLITEGSIKGFFSVFELGNFSGRVGPILGLGFGKEHWTMKILIAAAFQIRSNGF
ncbi:hypothetical protein FACS1894130_05600 [Spirochaetia bacterium]|nr:hypothetical protein FACS1894130_05600 [Spirochaetia bacterium]